MGRPTKRQLAAVRLEARKLVANLRANNGPDAGISEVEYQICEDDLVRSMGRGPLRADLGAPAEDAASGEKGK